jgi:hypothetical protein
MIFFEIEMFGHGKKTIGSVGGRYSLADQDELKRTSCGHLDFSARSEFGLICS